MKKSNNKGFTLVELIVVLVILAILAAILVPALLGYIDRARNQQIVLNARSCYTAAQAEMSQIYGTNEAASKIAEENHATSIWKTADVDGTTLVVGTKEAPGTPTTHGMYTITYVEYTENGITIYFDGKSWVETKPSTQPAKTYSIAKPSK